MKPSRRLKDKIQPLSADRFTASHLGSGPQTAGLEQATVNLTQRQFPRCRRVSVGRTRLGSHLGHFTSTGRWWDSGSAPHVQLSKFNHVHWPERQGDSSSHRQPTTPEAHALEGAHGLAGISQLHRGSPLAGTLHPMR